MNIVEQNKNKIPEEYKGSERDFKTVFDNIIPFFLDLDKKVENVSKIICAERTQENISNGHILSCFDISGGGKSTFFREVRFIIFIFLAC